MQHFGKQYCALARYFSPINFFIYLRTYNTKTRERRRPEATWGKRRSLYKVVHNSMAVFSSSQCLLSHIFLFFLPWKYHGISPYRNVPIQVHNLLCTFMAFMLDGLGYSLFLSSAFIVSAKSLAQEYHCETHCDISAEHCLQDEHTYTNKKKYTPTEMLLAFEERCHRRICLAVFSAFAQDCLALSKREHCASCPN